MSASEFVSGREEIDIFKQLEKEGIILHVHLRGTSLKQLVVVKRLTTKKKEWYFLIDCPQSFREKAGGINEWELAFAFIGEQGIPYRFATSGGGMVGDCDMLIKVPDAIERIHRRKHFRIKAHPAAVLKAGINGEDAEMRMIDISQGGALVMFSDKKGRMLTTGQELTDIRMMLLPGEKEAQSLRVNRAEVRSVALEPKSGLYHFGLMFVDLSKQEEKAIKDRIYVDQRQMLRKKTM
jgi:c-di-GMP-binding flagellar brake protein YcgR